MQVLKLVKETLVKVDDFKSDYHGFFLRPNGYEQLESIWTLDECKKKLLLDFVKAFESGTSIDQFLAAHNIKKKEFLIVLRILAIDSKKGPPISKLIDYFGPQEFASRLKAALND